MDFTTGQPPWLSQEALDLTLEDLTVDETLTPLQRCERYVCSPIPLQRLVHVKLLAETATGSGVDITNTVIVPLLGVLMADDKVVIRQHLPEQISIMAQYFAGGDDEGYALFLDGLLPCLSRLLGDNCEEVRISASEALVQVSGLVRPHDIGRHVLTVVLRLAHDDENDAKRCAATCLLSELSPCLGFDLSHQFLVPELVSLAEDPEMCVRKMVAWSMRRIFSTLGGPERLIEVS